MSENVRILVGAVERGVLTPAEALAKEYLTSAERQQLAALLADDE